MLVLLMIFFVIIQIIHLKRFQLVNGKWVKSHKIVQFPFKDFDPTNYLVPRNNNKRDAKQTLLSQTQHDSAKNSPSEPTSECTAATNGDSPATVSESPDADNKTHLPQDAGDVTSNDGGSSKDTNAASEANVSVEIEDYSDVRYDLKSLAVSTCFSAARTFKYYYCCGSCLLHYSATRASWAEVTTLRTRGTRPATGTSTTTACAR